MKISKMKIKVAGLCLLTWAFVSTSCSDYLDKTPDDATSITLEEVFSSEIYTERFLLKLTIMIMIIGHWVPGVVHLMR